MQYNSKNELILRYIKKYSNYKNMDEIKWQVAKEYTINLVDDTTTQVTDTQTTKVEELA